jgi:hypothetical protein
MKTSVHGVAVKKKEGQRLWYVLLNKRIMGAASERVAALGMASFLNRTLDENPQIEVPKERVVKVKKGAVSQAAQKRIKNRKAST